MSKQKQNTALSLPRSSAIIFLLRLLPTAAALVVLIYFSRTQGPSLYGRYQSFWIHYAAISAFTCMGLPSFAYSLNIHQLNGLMARLGKPILLVFITILALGGLAFAWLQHSNFPAWLPIVWMAFFTLSSLFEVYLTIARSFTVLIWINALFAIAFVWMHWAWSTEPLNLYELMIGVLFLGGIRCIALLLAFLKRKKTLQQDAVELLPMRSLQTLWMHLGSYDIAQQLFKNVDKVVATLLVSAPVFATYYNGSVEVPFLPILLGAAGSAALMHISSGVATNSPVATVRHTSVMLSSIVMPLFLFLMFYRYPLFSVVLGKYESAVPIFTIALLVVPLRCYNYTALLQHYGKGKIINIGALLDVLLALLLMWPLYHYFGLQGLAASFVISTYAQAVFYLVAAAKSARCKLSQLLPLQNWMWKAALFAAVLAILHYIPLYQNFPAMKLLIGSIAMMIMIAFSLYLDIYKMRQHGKTA